MKKSTYKGYIVYEDGTVISKKLGTAMKPKGANTVRYIKPNGEKQMYYLRLSLDGVEEKLHRIVWKAFYGEIPEGFQIDHKDDNKLNNHLDNLQLLTPSQNILKRFDKTKTTSKYPNVFYNKRDNNYRAGFNKNGIRYQASFKNEEDAYQWVLNKRKELGE